MLMHYKVHFKDKIVFFVIIMTQHGCNIVVTNPPFSLFREYVAVLMEHEKKFLIIGNRNAITTKELFPMIQQNKIWLGNGFANGNVYFAILKDADTSRYAKGVYDEATGLRNQ